MARKKQPPSNEVDLSSTPAPNGSNTPLGSSSGASSAVLETPPTENFTARERARTHTATARSPRSRKIAVPTDSERKEQERVPSLAAVVPVPEPPPQKKPARSCGRQANNCAKSASSPRKPTAICKPFAVSRAGR